MGALEEGRHLWRDQPAARRRIQAHGGCDLERGRRVLPRGRLPQALDPRRPLRRTLLQVPRNGGRAPLARTNRPRGRDHTRWSAAAAASRVVRHHVVAAHRLVAHRVATLVAAVVTALVAALVANELAAAVALVIRRGAEWPGPGRSE